MRNLSFGNRPLRKGDRRERDQIEFPHERKVKLVKVGSRLQRWLSCPMCGEWYRCDGKATLGCSMEHSNQAKTLQGRLRLRDR